MHTDDRPNILYIFTDQQSGCAMSCAGNDDLRTPSMDALAEDGVLFEQAYCTQPLCTPSRASMFTGVMPHECDAPRNGLSIQEAFRERELGKVLGRAGYECLYGGKWHIPEVSLPAQNDHGFRRFHGHDDAGLPDACKREFERWSTSRSAQRKPFFMVASFVNPHDICQFARSELLPLGPIGEPPPVTQCPSLPVNFPVAPYEPEILRVEQQANWGLYPTTTYTCEDWRRLRWAYCRLVEKVDELIGRVLASLRECGLDDNTVVIFSSDHGDGHGAHQWNQKTVLYEEVVRVPMILRALGGQRGIVDSRHLVSNGLDLLPTLCDYAGAHVPDGLRGRSLRPLVEGHTLTEWRDEVIIETEFDGLGTGGARGRAVRTERYKYIVYDRGRCPEQLFDLGGDPGEMVNLAVDQRYRNMLEEHRERLRSYIRRAEDDFRCRPLESLG